MQSKGQHIFNFTALADTLQQAVNRSVYSYFMSLVDVLQQADKRSVYSYFTSLEDILQHSQKVSVLLFQVSCKHSAPCSQKVSELLFHVSCRHSAACSQKVSVLLFQVSCRHSAACSQKVNTLLFQISCQQIPASFCENPREPDSAWLNMAVDHSGQSVVFVLPEDNLCDGRIQPYFHERAITSVVPKTCSNKQRPKNKRVGICTETALPLIRNFGDRNIRRLCLGNVSAKPGQEEICPWKSHYPSFSTHL